MMTSSIKQATAPVLSAGARHPRLRTAATWLFILPVLTQGVLPDGVKLQIAGLAVLAFMSIVILRDPLPFRAARHAYLAFAVLSLTAIGYIVFGTWPAQFGTSRSYDAHAALFVVMYTAVAVFAVLFFEVREFERVLWRGVTTALWIGVLTCTASRVTGHLLLVNPNDGALRMVGTLSEPSDWAALLTVVMLLALRRRSWLYVCLSLAGLLLADSPTCILVMAVSVVLYFVLATEWRARTATTAVLAVMVPLAVIFVRDANVVSLAASGNPAEVAIGRLVSGIRNVETGGQEGANSRYVSVQVVTADARDGGWMSSGAGPAADAVYFPAAYPSGSGSQQAANAMWLTVLFDFGEWGTAMLAVMMLVALWRMRRSPAMTALLLPFFTASLVNSAVPDYSFTVLGILLFAFGWAKRFPGVGDVTIYASG
jgi:hypothetical protein